jgi:hypothetical protein
VLRVQQPSGEIVRILMRSEEAAGGARGRCSRVLRPVLGVENGGRVGALYEASRIMQG